MIRPQKGILNVKRPIRTLAAAAAATALLGSFAIQGAGAEGATDVWPTYGNTYVLNPSGGVTGTDGLRVTFGGTQLQVQRLENDEEPECSGEIYDPCVLPGTDSADDLFSQVALAVGDSTNGGTAFLAPPLVDDTEYDEALVAPDTDEELIVKKAWNVDTTSSGDSIVSTLTGDADGLTYTVVVTITYTSPADRIKVDYEVIIPDGNTKPVRLYHLIDTYLGGDDEGPGFFTEPVACGSGQSGAVVGVDRADLGVIQAFQYIGGTPWTSYMSGYYDDVVFGDNDETEPATDVDDEDTRPHFGPGFMNDFNNQIIADPENDNGIGISWNFGIEPGTRTSTAKLIYSAEAVDPCSDPEAVSVANPDPTPEILVPSFTG
jgi:hypothetical protein